LAPSVQESTIRRWWRLGPDAPVLLAVGHRFDLLDVPAEAADRVLASVRPTGYRLGPMAWTPDRRLLIWVRATGSVGPVPEQRAGLRWRSLGHYLVAPDLLAPAAEWAVPPVPLSQPTLPLVADILPAVNRACAASPAAEEALLADPLLGAQVWTGAARQLPSRA
jgi:hypothetical protein